MGRIKIKGQTLQYFKNTNNEIFAYDELQVKQGYGKELISITETETDEILKPSQEVLNKQFNQQIYSKIEDLEKKQFRSFKALTFNPADEVAQNFFNQYEQEITDLRSQLI